jgi:hypothetical protein
MEYPMVSYGMSCGMSNGILWKILRIILWNLMEHPMKSHGISYEILWASMEYLIKSYGISYGISHGKSYGVSYGNDNTHP